MSDPKITKIENIFFAHQIENMGTDYNGFNQVYQKGATLSMTPCACAHPHQHWHHWRMPRPFSARKRRSLLARVAIRLPASGFTTISSAVCATLPALTSAPLDVALWDFAGKVYDAPIWQLLGRLEKDHSRLCFDLPRRREWRPEHAGGFC